MSSDLRSPARRTLRRVAIAAFAGFAVLIPLIYGFERSLLSMGRARNATREAPPEPFAPIEGGGLTRPPTSTAEESGMRDEDEVIGVEIGGRARAYRLSAMSSRTSHVVNDLLGGVPVTVTYCDMSDCVRAYTDPRGTAPLGLTVGGLYVDNGPGMVLKLDGVNYLQKSGRSIRPGSGSSLGSATIPFDLIEPTRTTWKEWVRRHPETDVYTGQGPVDPEFRGAEATAGRPK